MTPQGEKAYTTLPYLDLNDVDKGERFAGVSAEREHLSHVVKARHCPQNCRPF